MSDKKIVRCERCGKRLRKGGDNYRLDCTVVSDFDGYINISASQEDIEESIKEIELSGLTPQELEEQVYFRCKQKLCFNCRNSVVNFIKGLD